ncbi:pseudouridine synthase 10 isoform X2 [Oratosquilla oratoria]|uniref:pseudouridine synthase 10 isoform X2 n=1 Tax=Oratosquilla oratoria TaxID=337810 RepID=UPI003F762539
MSVKMSSRQKFKNIYQRRIPHHLQNQLVWYVVCDTKEEPTGDEQNGLVSSSYANEEDKGTTGHLSKKPKPSNCITCLDLLNEGCTSAHIEKMSEVIKDGDYDAKCFSVVVSLPLTLPLRIHVVWASLLLKFPEFSKEHRSEHITLVKDVWKNVVGPKIESLTKKNFLTGQNIDFCLQVHPTYLYDSEDCKILDKLCSEMFTYRRQHPKKFSKEVYTRSAVDQVLKSFSDEELIKIIPEPPPSKAGLSYEKMFCTHASVYVAGRYNKYSRELPQTPWFVEGERRIESSVQELICHLVTTEIKADSIKFSSSGREDVDVRCLGRGRPFVIELINPHRIHLSEAEMTKLQNEINSSTDEVKVNDLQIVSKSDISNLKEGEEEKTKSYCALCIIPEGHDSQLLDQLKDIKSLTLHQKTPLRVLHRRPLATRNRAIYKLSTSPLDNHFFKLHLTTQAGTYIKEFVHGDLGRTTPNLGSILGQQVDIVALDVEDVELDWPPARNR